MNSSVPLSYPMTSGSPPVFSISLSDHSFSELAASFARICDHSRPLGRLLFFSKRSSRVFNNSSFCADEKSFLPIVFFVFAAAALFIVAPILKAFTPQKRNTTNQQNRSYTQLRSSSPTFSPAPTDRRASSHRPKVLEQWSD